MAAAPRHFRGPHALGRGNHLKIKPIPRSAEADGYGSSAFIPSVHPDRLRSSSRIILQQRPAAARPAATRLGDRPVPATPSSSGIVTSTGGEYSKSPFLTSVRGILTRPARVSPLQSLWGDAQLLRVTVGLSEGSAARPPCSLKLPEYLAREFRSGRSSPDPCSQPLQPFPREVGGESSLLTL